MKTKNMTDDQLRNWLELSQSALENMRCTQGDKPSLAKQHTKSLLIVSRSLRQISEKIRERSRHTRLNAARLNS